MIAGAVPLNSPSLPAGAPRNPGRAMENLGKFVHWSPSSWARCSKGKCSNSPASNHEPRTSPWGKKGSVRAAPFCLVEASQAEMQLILKEPLSVRWWSDRQSPRNCIIGGEARSAEGRAIQSPQITAGVPHVVYPAHRGQAGKVVVLNQIIPDRSALR